MFDYYSLEFSSMERGASYSLGKWGDGRCRNGFMFDKGRAERNVKLTNVAISEDETNRVEKGN